MELPQAPLPPNVSHNRPILEPLAILDSRVDSSTQPPTRIVLVQWMGVAPEDSTWERWDDVRSAHHLADTVVFPGMDSVSSNKRKDKDSSPAVYEGRPQRSTLS